MNSSTFIKFIKAWGIHKTKRKNKSPKKEKKRKKKAIRCLCVCRIDTSQFFVDFPSSACSCTISPFCTKTIFPSFLILQLAIPLQKHLRGGSAIDCSHLSSGEAVCRRESIPASYENYVCVCVWASVCVVKWEMPEPISCIHHQNPMVVWSPVNAMVFTHSRTLLY